jgi:hypothetical protein
MGASNPNGVILLKEDEFTTEDEIKVTPSETILLDAAFGADDPR